MKDFSRIALLAVGFVGLLFSSSTALATESAATIASYSSELDAAYSAKANALNAIQLALEEAAPKIKEIEVWNGQLGDLTSLKEVVSLFARLDLVP